MATTFLACLIGAALPYTPLAPLLGFTPLPASYWPVIGGVVVAYACLAHIVKTAFVAREQESEEA